MSLTEHVTMTCDSEIVILIGNKVMKLEDSWIGEPVQGTQGLCQWHEKINIGHDQA